MRNRLSMKNILGLLFVPLFLFSCEDKMDEHYEVPGWVAESAWDILQEKGNYSIFLKAAELADYKQMLQGKSILTVMAPDDNAFTTYLKENKYEDVSDIEAEDLRRLIGFHLLYYSYNKEKLINFRPEGTANSEDADKNAGMYYKFRTYSANYPTVEIDRTNGKRLTVYHLDRFVPVFSYMYFQTKGIDAKSNYEYFYPNSTWTGAEGYNVSNASVNEYGIIANNGYIHTIDKVLEPLETIYTEIESREEYSEFFNLYNSYTSYNHDATLSSDYGAVIGVDSLYLHTHGSELPPIAMEWPVSSYQFVSMLTSGGYSIFAPTDSELNAFYQRFWGIDGGYESLNDIDPLVMKHLLRQFVYNGSIAFPEEIKSGKITNMYGVPFNFDPATVKDKMICVNGSFYGLNEMKDPPLFSSVVGPAFQYKGYTNYMYALDGSSLLNGYASNETSYIMLIPSNSQMEANGYFLRENNGKLSLQEDSEDGWVDVNSLTKRGIVDMHTVNGGSELKTSGAQAYAMQTNFSYLFVKDGMITSNAMFNRLIEPDYAGNPFMHFEEITNNGSAWSNGRAYSYDYAEGIFQPESSDGLQHALAVCNDQRYSYNAFVQLMKKANMVMGTYIPTIMGTRFIAFIPTNEAVKAALAQNKIPGIKDGSLDASGSLHVADADLDIDVLKSYLSSYFLLATENVITTYPYIGSLMKNGEYITPSQKMLKYTDTGSTLSVQLEDRSVANVIPTYDYFPFAFQDGCFHLIDAIL